MTLVVDALDYSYARPDLGVCQRAGVKVYFRYLSGSGKALSRTEALSIGQHGGLVKPNHEMSAGAYAGGTAAGHTAKAIAIAAARAVGIGPGHSIPYSVDSDLITKTDMGNAIAYLDAADDPDYPSHPYGEYDLVQAWWAHKRRKSWQTCAWSGGQLSPYAYAYQWRINQVMGGGAVDWNMIIDWNALNAWNPTGADPTPAPTPSPLGGHQMFELVRVTGGPSVYAVTALSIVHVPDPKTLATLQASPLCLNGGKERTVSPEDWLLFNRMIRWNAQSANTANVFDPVATQANG